MKKNELKQFSLKVAAICLFIVSFFMVDSLLIGTLPLLAGVLLLPAAFTLTVHIFQLSMRPLPKKGKRATIASSEKPITFVKQPRTQKMPQSKISHDKVA